MPEFFVELTWRCAACAKDNRGRDKVCAGCGKPMKGEAFVDPAPSATPTSAVTEPEIVRQAGAGPDWRCVHCGSRQRRDDGACANCGGAQAVPSASHRPAVTSTASSTIPRPLAAATGSLGQAAATSRAGPATARAGKPRQLAIPFVLAPIVAFAGVILFPLLAALDVLPASLWLLFVLPAFSAVGALVLFFMGGTGVGVVRLPPKTVRPEPSGPWWTRRRTLGVAAALVAAVGAAAWICWPRVVDATVAERSWRHSVEVERYQLTREEGFDPPGDAVDRRSLGSRVHHTERRKVGEDVESYTESEPCGTSCTTTPVTCVDQDNGFKRCSGGDNRCETKYCAVTKTRRVPRYEDVEIERTYYAWMAWRWVHQRSVALEGSEGPTSWPSDEAVALGRGVAAPEKERAQRVATYRVVFQDDAGERHTYEPGSLAEFEALPRGARRRLRVGAVSGTSIVGE